MSFKELLLIEPILRAIKDEGYTTPTPIQIEAIPSLLEGSDLLGSAQTGTGKTAAFAIPILQNISTTKQFGFRTIKALILTPTRELAAQINASFMAYGKYLPLKTAVIYGGVSQKPQTDKLRLGVDILIATPGRLLDLINQKFVKLQDVKYFVLDEADHMLDMGFIHDVKRIINLIPEKRQTMMFSATMPYEITSLANAILKNPIRVAITPVTKTIDAIKQEVYYVNKSNKINLLIHLLSKSDVESALVFSRTKHGANKIAKQLLASNIKTDAIHGNKSQTARTLALDLFKKKKIKVLVATDIAARGLDIDELSHVVNFDLPEVPETYIHRIGRTGRAGLGGIAISFCSSEERKLLRDIQKHISLTIPVEKNHPFAEEVSEVVLEKEKTSPLQSIMQSRSRTRLSKPSPRRGRISPRRK